MAARPSPASALGRNHGNLVALVGDGQTIRAFDAITGAPVGQFSTASLAGNGLTTVDGIGSTNNRRSSPTPRPGPSG